MHSKYFKISHTIINDKTNKCFLSIIILYLLLLLYIIGIIYIYLDDHHGAKVEKH